MTQKRLHFTASASEARVAATALEAVFEEDAFPVAAFEVDEDRGIWSVSVYAPETDLPRVRAAMNGWMRQQGREWPIGEETLEDSGWVERTLEGLSPVRAGGFVVHGSHDAGCARASEIPILIEAGMAFGTGHHGTTAGCLAMIGDFMKARRFANALDLGSGTGVLAIAIAREARIPVMATDIDPVATAIAAQNARANGVAANIATVTAPGFAHREIARHAPFDLIVANILAGPLHAMATDLARHTSRGGIVILSGLLPHQKARIVARYRTAGLHLLRSQIRNGWLVLAFVRP